MTYIDVIDRHDVEIPTKTFNRFLKFWAMFYELVGEHEYSTSQPFVDILADKSILIIFMCDKNSHKLYLQFPAKYNPPDGSPDFHYLCSERGMEISSYIHWHPFEFEKDLDEDRIKDLLDWLYT
jgi:hypothetical protein